METGSNQHPRGASKCDDTHCEYSPADFREERWVFVEKEVSLDVFLIFVSHGHFGGFFGGTSYKKKLEVVKLLEVGKKAEALYQLVAQILFVWTQWFFVGDVRFADLSYFGNTLKGQKGFEKWGRM